MRARDLLNVMAWSSFMRSMVMARNRDTGRPLNGPPHSDDEALEKAEALKDAHGVEVWDCIPDRSHPTTTNSGLILSRREAAVFEERLGPWRNSGP
jgi:hypothetical protein